ncbi:MAG: HAD family hydrolase [Akkermansiaceae bacterium]
MRSLCPLPWIQSHLLSSISGISGKSSQNALIVAWSASRFYNRTTAEGLINRLDWNIGQEIDGLITTSDVKNGRPHPEMIHLAISKCGLKKSSRVAKVGDFVIDIKEGESAVTTGV